MTPRDKDAAKAEAIRDEMLRLSDYIVDTERTIREGKMLDLTGLDEKVSNLCDRTLALPPTLAMEIQPLMAEMIGHLEVLSVTLQNYKPLKS